MDQKFKPKYEINHMQNANTNMKTITDLSDLGSDEADPGADLL